MKRKRNISGRKKKGKKEKKERNPRLLQTQKKTVVGTNEGNKEGKSYINKERHKQTKKQEYNPSKRGVEKTTMTKKRQKKK